MTSATFSSRHSGLSKEDIEKALKVIGEDSLEALINKTIPASIQLKEPLKLENAMSEYQYINHIKGLASKNKVFKTYIGLGYYPTKVPAVIQRNILENSAWYTAYTPYQAEIAQGRLEALLNFQTMVTDLTAMDLANASLLDEATAVAEGMSLMYGVRSREAKKGNWNKLFVSNDCFPQTIALLETRSEPLGIEIVYGNPEEFTFEEGFFGAVLQYPNKNGEVKDYHSFIQSAHAVGALVTVASDLLSLALLTPPGEWGADIVCGTTQRFGIPMGFGGPHAAYFATRDEYKRSIPGRIIGLSVDADGKAALRMALQTREQHIKRDRATSNICTAQVLLAVMAGMYAVYHGKDGIKKIASGIHAYTNTLKKELIGLGFDVNAEFYFDTIQVGLKDEKASGLIKFAEERCINIRKIDDSNVSISIDETVEYYDLLELVNLFASFKGVELKEDLSVLDEDVLPSNLLRKSKFFNPSRF